MSQAEFDACVLRIFLLFYREPNIFRLVRSVRSAILEGVHPKMITKGSSGSYFAREKVEGRVQTVGCVTCHDRPVQT
jgi:hypothetical protein